MTDTIQETTAAPASTLGTKVDSLIAEWGAWKAAEEAKAKAAEKAVSTWVKANWPHFVTWLGVAYTVMRKLI